LAGAGDPQVVGDGQRAAGQGDGALQPAGEADSVGPGVGVGVEDGLAQRAGAVVGQVQDGEGAGQRPVFEYVEVEPGAGGRLGCPAASSSPRRSATNS
jgi:hypothetical protein